MIKKIFFCWVILGMALPSYASSLNKIVAIVNGDVITQQELDKRKEIINQQQAKNNLPEVKTEQVLDSMIFALLQLQLAQRNGMQIDDAELDNIIAGIAKSNHMTIEQFKNAVQEHEGLSFKEYRDQFREQVLINRVQHRFLGRELAVNEEDINKVLRNPPKASGSPAQYHVADILIEMPDQASAKQVKEANNIATKVIKKLKQGIKIEQIEQEYGSQVHNNDLDWRRADELPALFAKEVTKMHKGQVIGPLKAPNGLHLIRLLDVQSVQSQPEKLTKEQAQEIAFRQKLAKRLKPWLEELRAAAYVKIIK
jgi:peptidyl-prolyl cis-trans isomerase SurA